MNQLQFSLVEAVQDLFDIYQSVNPAGPFRHPLFGDRDDSAQCMPDSISQNAGTIDDSIRGISCLLANDLGASSFPLLQAAWKSVRLTAKQAGLYQGPEPEYYRYISYELVHPRAVNSAEAYRLFGEVMAVYLDVLSALGFKQDKLDSARIEELRSRLAYSGDSAADASSADNSGSSGNSAG